MRRIAAVVLLLTALVSIQVTAAQNGDNSTPGLDLIIVLDNSGSMDQPTGKNLHYRNIDYGQDLLFTSSVNTLPATDPDGIRYGTTAMALEWLADYAGLQSDSFDINASVVGFEDSPTGVLSDWTQLKRHDTREKAFLQSALDQSGRIKTDSSHPQNANFIALYQQLDQLFDNAPGGTGHQRTVLIITDSVPCVHDDKKIPLSNPENYYDPYCENTDRMVNHINSLSSLGGADQFVLFVNPVDAAQRWQKFPGVREAWVSKIGQNNIVDLANMGEVPLTMMRIVMRELALGHGVQADKLPTRLDADLDSGIYSQLNILFASGGQFDVGPYQSYMDVLAPTRTSQTVLTTAPVDNSAPTKQSLFGSDQQLLRQNRFRQPKPGQWSVDAGSGLITPAWIMFRSAEAHLSLLSDTPTRLVPQQVTYELIDDTGAPFPVTADTVPVFDLEITPPGGASPINLSQMQINEDGNGLVSPAFLPLAAGPYKLKLTVSPDASSLWRALSNTDFLNPQRLPNLQVAGLTFNADFTVIGASGQTASSTTSITLPRSLPLDVQVTAHKDDGSAIALPQGVSASLHFAAPTSGNDACLTPIDQPMDINAQTRESATKTIQFDNPGGCTVSVDLNVQSSLPPLNDTPQSIPSSDLSRQLVVTKTRRLTFQMMDQPGIAQKTGDLSYEMDDRDPTVLQWTPNTFTLRLEVRDEENKLTAPQFLPGQQSVSPAYCASQGNLLSEATRPVIAESTEAATAEATASVTPTTNAAPITIDTSRVVPFHLTITNGAEHDIVPDNKICLQATASDGVYLATLSDLPPDNYKIKVSVDRANPALEFKTYEYAPNLFTNPADQTYETTLNLKVDPNRAIPLQALGSLAVVTIVGIVGTSRYRKGRNASIAPLSAEPAIYRVPESAGGAYERNSDAPASKKPAELIWTGTIPPQINHHVFPSTDFNDHPDVAVLDIVRLTLSTNRENEVSDAGGAYSKLELSEGGVPLDLLLGKGEAAQFNVPYSGNYRYYLANGLVSPSVEQLLKVLVK